MMSGSITVLDASDNSSLAVLEAALGGIMLDWGRVTKPLPPAALGRPVRFEFRFPSDNMAEFAGWYIDAIELTVPKPRPPPQNKDQAFTPVSCLHRTVDRLWLASVGVRGSGNRLLKFADSTNQ